MKRDWELMKKILHKIYDENGYNIEGYDIGTIYTNLKMLDEQSMLDIDWIRVAGSIEETKIPTYFALTWEGQNFVELTKNETSWNKAKDYINKNNPDFFDVIYFLKNR